MKVKNMFITALTFLILLSTTLPSFADIPTYTSDVVVTHEPPASSTFGGSGYSQWEYQILTGNANESDLSPTGWIVKPVGSNTVDVPYSLANGQETLFHFYHRVKNGVVVPGPVYSDNNLIQFRINPYDNLDIKWDGNIIIPVDETVTKVFKVISRNGSPAIGIDKVDFSISASDAQYVELVSTLPINEGKDGWEVKLKGLRKGAAFITMRTHRDYGAEYVKVAPITIQEETTPPYLTVRGINTPKNIIIDKPNPNNSRSESIVLTNKSAVMVDALSEINKWSQGRAILRHKVGDTFQKVAQDDMSGSNGFFITNSVPFNLTKDISREEYTVELSQLNGDGVEIYPNRFLTILKSPYKKFYTTSVQEEGANYRVVITKAYTSDYQGIITLAQDNNLPPIDAITVGLSNTVGGVDEIPIADRKELTFNASGVAELLIPKNSFYTTPHLIIGNKAYDYAECLPLSGNILSARFTNVVSTGITSSTQFTPKALIQYNGVIHNLPTLSDESKYKEDGLSSEVILISDTYNNDITSTVTPYKTKLNTNTLSDTDKENLYEGLTTKIQPSWTSNNTGKYKVWYEGDTLVNTLKDLNVVNSGNYLIGLKVIDKLGNKSYDVKQIQLQVYGSNSVQISAKNAPNIKLSSTITNTSINKMESLNLTTMEGDKLVVHGIKHNNLIYVGSKATSSNPNILEVYDLNLNLQKSFTPAQLGMTSIKDFEIYKGKIVIVGTPSAGGNNIVTMNGTTATPVSLGDLNTEIHVVRVDGDKMILGSQGANALVIVTEQNGALVKSAGLTLSSKQIFGVDGRAVKVVEVSGRKLIVSDGTKDSNGSAVLKFIDLPY